MFRLLFAAALLATLSTGALADSCSSPLPFADQENLQKSPGGTSPAGGFQTPGPSGDIASNGTLPFCLGAIDTPEVLPNTMAMMLFQIQTVSGLNPINTGWEVFVSTTVGSNTVTTNDTSDFVSDGDGGGSFSLDLGPGAYSLSVVNTVVAGEASNSATDGTYGIYVSASVGEDVPLPEPASLSLLGFAVAGLTFLRRSSSRARHRGAA